ncbi:MAG TPA: hypothetical protein O0W87_02390 [Methanocorpusculum sp.]|nr:hypothetical protein [Methanocorpusculum sp.]
MTFFVGGVSASSTITIETEKESYYLEDDVVFTGTNTFSENVYLFIKGVYLQQTYLSTVTVSDDGTWTTTFDLIDYLNLEVGAYTIYAASEVDVVSGKPTINRTSPYATEVIYFKEPFISAFADSSTVAQGENIQVSGIALGRPKLIMYYVFGQNRFESSTASVNNDDSFSLQIDTDTYSAGQYFLVIQHPMFDGSFNVGPVPAENGGYDIKMNANGAYTSGDAVLLFNILGSQSANAAEALCYALDSQNIDDTYAKLTFVVESPYLTVNSFSSSYTKGELIEITGTANPVTDLNYYIFGQDTFFTGTIPVTSNRQYSLRIYSDTVEGYDFFVVIQHPMYDGVFNVGPVSTATRGYDIKMDATGGYTSADAVTLFNTLYRQGENAAEELCQAISSQDIDDIWAKLYFSASSNPPDLVLTPGYVLQSLTVSPEYSPAVTEGTPVSVNAQLTIAKDSISTSESLRFITDLRQSTSWTIDVYKGTMINNLLSEDAFITTLASSSFAYTISGFVLDYDQPITLVIKLTGLYPAVSDNITALKIDGPDFTYSYLYGPTQSVPSFGDELKLQPGWNFISVPKTLNQTANTAGALFGSVDTDDKNILGYNTQTKSWIPLRAADIIQPMTGYWIYAATGTTISFTYPSAPTSPSVKTLSPGWNAVGLSAGESTSAKTALTGTSWRTLIPWNLAGTKYDTAIVNGGSNANSPDRLMTIKNGYWLYADAQSTLVGLTA